LVLCFLVFWAVEVQKQLYFAPKKLFFGFGFWFCANKVVLLCLEKRERFGRWEIGGTF
jgi:hypothetical protein